MLCSLLVLDLRVPFCEEKTGRFLCHHLDRVGEFIFFYDFVGEVSLHLRMYCFIITT